MRILDIPKSGRQGDYVYYMRGRKLCRRRYVVPRNVRTAARRLVRGKFGSFATAWGGLLTQEQRRGWIALAKTVQSKPRLWQSGSIFGEMLFESINMARARIGREMLLWAPEPVKFGPTPVSALIVSYVNDQLRLRLRVSGPITGDLMVFGQAPCSAGRKKWRHGAYLGLAPAPQSGESDITDLYVKRYGEPAPGKKVFIRLRQQQEGWEGKDCELSEVVPARPVVAARPGEREIRRPKTEGRKQAEARKPKAAYRARVPASPGRRVGRKLLAVGHRSRTAGSGVEGSEGARGRATLERPRIRRAS